MFRDLHTHLDDWYRTHGRHDLPWRRTADPYAIWVSEIMLQQTQVKTVLERFYFPFLQAFPTLQDLADADLDDVLKKWEGLGYYTRARNLHRAARLCAPRLPRSVTELAALPGIGRSTAHAVAAFAYHTPLPILDANVKRILLRFFAMEQAADKALWEAAHALFDAERPFDYNQAMMDLGALVCTPKAPLCRNCPLHSGCRGSHDPLAYPAPRTSRRLPVRRRTIVVYRRGGRYGLTQRTGRFLHGLWGFAEFESCDTALLTPLGTVVQKYSHFTLEAGVFLAPEDFETPESLVWHERREIAALALSAADQKVLVLADADDI